MAITIVDSILFVLFLISVPLYVILLVGIWKYRKEHPFNKPFFKITFSLGIFDVFHLLVNWIGKFASLGWFGVNKIVMLAPNPFSKLASVLWWYTAFGQKLGVFLTAVNRTMVISYSTDWTPTRTALVLAIHWIVPAVLTTPQMFLEYGYYTINGSSGVFLYWKNETWQYLYFDNCTWYCGIIGILCGIGYAKIFWKARKNGKSVKHSRRVTRKTSRSFVTELKLAIVGVVLCILTIACGIYCGALAGVRDPKVLEAMLPYQNVLFDVYAWCNPYLLLLCSRHIRVVLRAVISCNAGGLLSKTTHTVTKVKPADSKVKADSRM